MNSHTKQRPKGSKKNPLEVMKLQLKRGKTSELGSAGARQLEKRESGGEGGREMVVKTWKIPLEPAPEGIAGLSSEGLLWGAAVLLGKEQGWVVWGGLQGSPLCPPSQQLQGRVDWELPQMETRGGFVLFAILLGAGVV